MTLFREHINLVNKKKEGNENNKDYTEIEDAENVPEYCNSFINQFLFPNKNSNDFSISKDESIDLIQNICYWMYDNNFTSKKICLMNEK